jgi:hypothetical protein
MSRIATQRGQLEKRGAAEPAVAITKYNNYIFEDLIYEPKHNALFHKKREIPWGLVYTMTFSKRANRMKKEKEWIPYIYKAAEVTDVEGVAREILKDKLEAMVKYITNHNEKNKPVNLNI